MNYEHTFDRVPGCRDKRKAKRAANLVCQFERRRTGRQAKALGITAATYGAHRHRRVALRYFMKQADL